MFLASLAFLIYASASALAQQIVYDTAHNTTAISGTWSSGSGNVTTGPIYVDAANQTFNYPVNTGVSYSFYETSMWYEVLRYRMVSNGSSPQCITTVLNWVHGTFALQPNGSITLFPVGDGFQRIEAPCAARSDFTEGYNDTELITQWQIFTDPIEGPKLHLFAFDGSPLPPLHLLSTTPTMLPTQRLRNPPQASTTVLKRSTNVAPSIHWWNVAAITSMGAMLCSVLLI